MWSVLALKHASVWLCAAVCLTYYLTVEQLITDLEQQTDRQT